MYSWKTNKYIKISLCAFAVIAASLVLVSMIIHLDGVMRVIRNVLGVLSPFIWGFAIAYILNYPYRLLMRGMDKLRVPMKKGIQKGICITLTYVLFFAVLFLFFYLIIPQIVNAVVDFIEEVPKYMDGWIESGDRLLKKYLTRFDLSYNDVLKEAEAIGKRLGEGFDLRSMMDGAITVVLDTSLVLKNVFLGIIVSVYLLLDKERFTVSGKRLLYAVFQPKRAARILDVLRFTDKTFGGFLISKIVDSTIVGILCYIFMAIMNMDYAVLISVLVGVTNVIPFFGPFIGGIPSVLLLLLINPWEALIFGIFVIILQQFDGNFLGPKLMGETMGIRAVFVVFAVIVGGGLFGVLGMFVGVPAFVVIYTLITEWIAERLKKKQITIEE